MKCSDAECAVRRRRRTSNRMFINAQLWLCVTSYSINAGSTPHTHTCASARAQTRTHLAPNATARVSSYSISNRKRKFHQLIHLFEIISLGIQRLARISASTAAADEQEIVLVNFVSFCVRRCALRDGAGRLYFVNQFHSKFVADKNVLRSFNERWVPEPVARELVLRFCFFHSSVVNAFTCRSLAHRLFTCHCIFIAKRAINVDEKLEQNAIVYKYEIPRTEHSDDERRTHHNSSFS